MRIGSRRFRRIEAPGDFHVPNQADPVQRMMMHQGDSFPFMRGDQFDALELPYKGGKMAMLIVLPKSNDGLKALEGKLSADFLDHVVAGLEQRFVQVSIPKFTMSWQDSLKVGAGVDGNPQGVRSQRGGFFGNGRKRRLVYLGCRTEGICGGG